MSTRSPLLDARNLTRRSHDQNGRLLDDISLSVHAGDRIAVLGPTGSGKTLLLRALSLLDPIDSGTLTWRGETVTKDWIPDYRRQVLYVSQRPCLVPETVEDNLRLPYTLQIHRPKAFDPEVVVALLRLLGRDDGFLSKETMHLSGGENQIVAMLRAIQLEPLVLLLDEPTASLDATASRLVEQLVGEWFSSDAKQRAFIWVTHDAEQAERVADRVMTLHAGQVDETEE